MAQVFPIRRAYDHRIREIVCETGNPRIFDHLRILAQVDVSFSNSMIEAVWRSLRHQWLYLHSLDSFAAVERLVGFYVSEHNSTMPHSAFAGQTPDEIYFGHDADVEKNLVAARHQARNARMATNRRASCGVCRPLTEGQTASETTGVAVAPP